MAVHLNWTAEVGVSSDRNITSFTLEDLSVLEEWQEDKPCRTKQQPSRKGTLVIWDWLACTPNCVCAEIELFCKKE